MIKERKCLLVASNRDRPQNAELFLPCLKEFAEKPGRREKIYRQLIELVVKNIYFLDEDSAKKGRRKTVSEQLVKENLTKNFRKMIDSYYQKVKNEVEFEEDTAIKEILTEAKKVSDEMKEKGLINSSEWEYLIPLDDLNIIAEAIEEGKLGSDLFQNYCCILGDEGVHAEIKIVNDIYQFNQQQGKLGVMSILKNFLLLKGRKEYYIGLSKLTCAPCQAILDLFNKKLKWLLKFNFQGSHGASYGSDWILPAEIKQEFCQKVSNVIQSKLLYNKLRETTNEIHNNGLKESYYAERLKQSEAEQSQQAQIIQSYGVPGTSKK